MLIFSHKLIVDCPFLCLNVKYYTIQENIL
nr:MAG TPA: hypothetical protein [Caudoviricetes sp.]DAO86961.1 MAG TPA: hypothetical protein [Caudoviricetes sp.]